ncbi:hypothetical protein Bca52824_091909 [Brassica carinata]|uniref:Pectinesterase inhibitor domain-containing protein n=1 Tax=Brassica carinata TaxID=52824 RepID=A0A8X7NVU7_BRACI|nr:hypothetical protein Bca52824_091909 [Brassica carinata]
MQIIGINPQNSPSQTSFVDFEEVKYQRKDKQNQKMAFQDFDLIQERVNADRKRKFRKKITIGVVSTLVVVAVITGGAFAYVTFGKKSQEPVKATNTNSKAKGSDKSSEKSTATPSNKPPSSAAAHSDKPGQVDKIIKALCNSTLYKPSCEKTLKNGAKTASPLSDPRSLLKSSIKATNEDLVKDALAQCKLLVDEAKEELNTSMKRINDTKVNSFAKIAPDLDTWLSAVMSHQETCLDGFEEGKLRTEIRKNFNSSQMMTSNSLAMIKSLDAYLSKATKVKTRHLLESRSSWLGNKERRMLKAVDVKALKPNAIVAKDGSGNFTTINAALKAMPAKYKGRYTIYIKHGVYDESVIVDKKKANVTMVGDGSQKTIVTGNKSHAKKVRTFLTATFGIS